LSHLPSATNNPFTFASRLRVLGSHWLALAKFKIVILVVICALIGWLTGLGADRPFDLLSLSIFLTGLSLLSSGSLALNQVQELQVDSKMKRTQNRPIASGQISLLTGFLLSVFPMMIGTAFLLTVSVKVAVLGLITVLLYNGLYTLNWKPKMAFAAVPGAVPGALPVVMGYAGSSNTVINAESVYLFMILFLWQMPHFWALAIKYKNDYADGGIPVLPVVVGDKRALIHIGAYLFVYVVFALCAPLFTFTYWVFYLASIPMTSWLILTYFKYYRVLNSPLLHPKSSSSEDFSAEATDKILTYKRRWLGFFLAVSLSLLVFLLQPLLDRWLFLFLKT